MQTTTESEKNKSKTLATKQPKRNPNQQKKAEPTTQRPPQEETRAGVAATLQTTNRKINQIQAQQARIILELREQVAKQNHEIARLKRQLLATRAKERWQDLFAAFPKITHFALQDPNGLREYLLQMQKTLLTRMAYLQNSLATR